jgi:hypothetical protein
MKRKDGEKSQRRSFVEAAQSLQCDESEERLAAAQIGSKIPLGHLENQQPILTTDHCFSAMLTGMDKEILLRHLAEVENRAALGDLQIAGQRARVEQLERAGWGVTEGKALLVGLEDCQRRNLERRDRLITELWTPRRSFTL